MDLIKLSDQIAEYFNTEELRSLCFAIGVKYGNLRGEGHSQKAEELVTYCYRHGKIEVLLKKCTDLRPKLEWPKLSTSDDPKHPPKALDEQQKLVTLDIQERPDIRKDNLENGNEEPIHTTKNNMTIPEKRGCYAELGKARLYVLLSIPLLIGILILLSLQTYRATKSANEAEATLAAVLANLPTTRETLTFTATPTPTDQGNFSPSSTITSESETKEPLIHTPSSTPTTILISTSIPTASSSPTSTPTPSLIVPTEGESSIIQVTTGLGAKTELEYSMKNTGHGILDHILSESRNSTGAEYIVIEIDDDVYRILPLKTFLSATKPETANTQTISLINGEDIEGNLVGRLANSEGEDYDLNTAKEVVLISLSEGDSSFEIEVSDSTAAWELEMLSPIESSMLVSNPRFSFQYSTFSSVGTYHDHEKTTQAFELVVNEEELLGNLSEIDEIQFGGEEDVTIVRVGDNETRGRLFLRTKGSTFTSSHHYRWFLVADLVNSEGMIAFWNGNEQPVANLRKASE